MLGTNGQFGPDGPKTRLAVAEGDDDRRQDTEEVTAASTVVRRSSLRRRWNRAFATMLVLSLLGAAASMVVVTRLAQQSRAAAEEVERESAVVVRLRHALALEEGMAHALLGSNAVAGRFLAADEAVLTLLDEAGSVFNDSAERALVGEIRRRWETTFSFGRAVASGKATGTTAEAQDGEAAHESLAKQMNGVVDTLDELAETSLRPIRRQLTDGERAERQQLILLYVLLAISVVVTVHFARRFRRDVLRPIHKLREATGRVGAGDLHHRVELDHNDEFGELASTFNDMAGAVDAHQRQLTEQLYGRARLAAIVESSDQAILGLARDLVVTSWNPGAERLYGYTAEEAVGCSAIELLLPPDKASGNSVLCRVAAGERISGYETEVRTKDGTIIPISVAASPILDPSGAIVGISSIAEDISERKVLEERLHHQAFHDPLTNLANRALLQDRLDHALARHARSGGLLAVVLLDLDDFKSINDSLGHRAGDELLGSVADQLRRCTRAADTLARLGGDEFAILLEDLANPAEAVQVAERIVEALSSSFSFEGRAFPVSASVGVAFAEAGLATVDDVIRDADVAMYLAKSTAKGSFTVFEPGMHLAVKHRLQLKAELAKAMSSDELTLHYQPIVDLPTGQIVGVEALARWHHPELGMVPPVEFIPIAEESGLIVPLGIWVLETACREVQRWQQAGDAPASLHVSVNVSGRQLEDPHFVDKVRHVLDQLGFDPAQLVLEITESVLVSKAHGAIDKLHALKRLGVRLAIDDFGTGYSSLGSLQELPVDILKIDKSFVDRLDGDDEQANLARAVLGLGHSLQLETVAEGVETISQADELNRLHCNMAQGYYFARPADAGTVAMVLHERAQRTRTTPAEATGAPAPGGADSGHQSNTPAAAETLVPSGLDR